MIEGIDISEIVFLEGVRADRSESINRFRDWAKNDKCVVVNVQTTGLEYAKVIEICIRRVVDNKCVFYATFNPNMPEGDWDYIALGMHKHRMEQFNNSIASEGYKEKLRQVLESYDLIAYNAAFVYRYISKEFGLSVPEIDCVMESYAPIMGNYDGQYDSYSYVPLDKALSHEKLDFEKTNEGLEDTRAVIELINVVAAKEHKRPSKEYILHRRQSVIDQFKRWSNFDYAASLSCETTSLEGEVFEVCCKKVKDGSELINFVSRSDLPLEGRSADFHSHRLDEIRRAPDRGEFVEQLEETLIKLDVVTWNADFHKKMISKTYGVHTDHFRCAMELYAILGNRWSDKRGNWKWLSLLDACILEGVLSDTDKREYKASSSVDLINQVIHSVAQKKIEDYGDIND